MLKERMIDFLHPLVINPTFLFPLYFIKVGGCLTGSFLHIYTN